MNQNIEGFDILFENNSCSSYLVLKSRINNPMIHYQVQMLLNNKVNGLLDFNMNYTNEVPNCYYNVTSKCTLASYLSRKQFSRDEFLFTILNIINILYHLKDYLLFENNVLLDENHIFVEPESMHISFVYLPFYNCQNDIKSFFINLIFKLIKFQEETSDNYIQRILEEVKKDLFNLSSLKSLIENLLGEEIREGLNKTSNTLDSSDNPECIQKLRNEKPDNRVLLNEIKANISKPAIIKSKIKIPNDTDSIALNNKLKDTNLKKDNEDCADHTFNKTLTIIFALQLPLLITYLLTIKSKFIKLDENPKTAVLLLTFIFIAVDILIVRVIMDNMKKKGDTICKPLQFISAKMKCSDKLKEDSLHNVKEVAKEQMTMPDESYKGETVILKKNKADEAPCLKEKDGTEVINLNRKSTIIGRMESFVDYVIDSNAIGKIHAEILKEDGNFYIMDCNTKNGTYLNDCRLIPNTKQIIKDNDLIRFANKEYVFIFTTSSKRSST